MFIRFNHKWVNFNHVESFVAFYEAGLKEPYGIQLWYASQDPETWTFKNEYERDKAHADIIKEIFGKNI